MLVYNVNNDSYNIYINVRGINQTNINKIVITSILMEYCYMCIGTYC